MALKLNDVVTFSGIPGLHKVVKADTKNVLIESLEANPKRQLVKGSIMVSKLSDISIYTDTEEGESLVKIFQAISEKYGKTLPVQKKSSNPELMEFLESVLPNYDKERVYASNVKKIVQWYEILMENEVLLEVEDTTEAEGEEVAENSAE
ncbi:MAG: DUF5606 domain-containing protein [Bacteroidia bacterium]|nr:DUF5606 domain-containing protein [Bacteroidia bacterium]